MNEHTIPLFSESEVLPLIDVANDVISRHRLPERWDQRARFPLLGEAVGPLHNYEVVYLLDASVSRLIDDAPHVPGPNDYFVNCTILYLYRTAVYAAQGPTTGVEAFQKFERLLTRLFERHLENQHHVQFDVLSADQRGLLLDIGHVLLEREFPVNARPGRLQNVPSSDPIGFEPYVTSVWNNIIRDVTARGCFEEWKSAAGIVSQ